jgi:hypothetical protein
MNKKGIPRLSIQAKLYRLSSWNSRKKCKRKFGKEKSNEKSFLL